MAEATYPRPALTVDIVVYSRRDFGVHVLLIQRAGEPFAGCWALPGGFVNLGETIEAAAYRELFEETGLRLDILEQLHTFGDPGRDPRGWVVSVAYIGSLPAEQCTQAKSGSDAVRASWFSLDELPELAFDHARILTCALNRLGDKAENIE